ASVDVDGQKTAPRRLLTRPADLRLPESRRRPQWTRARPRRAPAFRIPLHLPDAAQILRVDEQVAQLRVERHPISIAPAERAGEDDRRLGGVMRVRPFVMHAAVAVEQGLAIFAVFGRQVGEFFALEAVARERRGLERKGLRGPTRFARHISFWNRSFLDA